MNGLEYRTGELSRPHEDDAKFADTHLPLKRMVEVNYLRLVRISRISRRTVTGDWVESMS